MRSLIILEVEHGGDTDGITSLAEALAANRHIYRDVVSVTNYTVRVDLPECECDIDILAPNCTNPVHIDPPEGF